MKKSKIIKGLSYAACIIEGGLLFPLGSHYPWTLIFMIPLILFTVGIMPIIFTHMQNNGN